MLLKSQTVGIRAVIHNVYPDLPIRRDVKHVVLGAGGFVGGAMVERLRREHAQVVPVIHRIGPGAAFLARFELQMQIADLRDTATLQDVFKGADTVFHCVTGDRASAVQGLSHSLEAAKSAGVRRFVYLSSLVVHGFSPNGPVVETLPLNPPSWSDYAKNKSAAEKIIANWRGGPETVVLRPSIVYGPRSKSWSEAPAREIVAGTAYLVEEGRGHMNDIHIAHLLDAMLLAAYHPNAANQIYVLQDGFGLTWGEYYRSLCGLLGKNLDSLRAFSLQDVESHSSKLRQFGRWAKDTSHVLRSAVWHDPLKSWLKRAPGFESLRGLVPGVSAYQAANGVAGHAAQARPRLDVALLHAYPQPVDDAKIRRELGFAPRFSFAETLDGLRRWYRFIGLVR